MTNSGDLTAAFKQLGIDRSFPVIAHASLSSLGTVQGGPDVVVEALLSAWDTLVMPAFTYKTMLIPEAGPPENGITYGSGKDRNLMAEIFSIEMPADKLMGVIPEQIRRLPEAKRSNHPILSFTGVNAAPFLESQTLSEPLAPIRLMYERGGWVLLIGVNHTVNTSIHYAEFLAGRKQFIRWALTSNGVIECPGFPGCSDGFEMLSPWLENETRHARVGQGFLKAISVRNLVSIATTCIEENPRALLCDHKYCERCQAVKKRYQCKAISSTIPLHTP